MLTSRKNILFLNFLYNAKNKTMKILFPLINHNVLTKRSNNFAPKIYPANNFNKPDNYNAYCDAIKNYNLAFMRKEEIPVYAIDNKGKYTRYDSYAIAAKELSLQKRIVARCANGDVHTTGAFTFIKAEDFEIRDEDNNPVLDKYGNIKIKEDMLAKCLKRFKNTAIYSIDKNGKWQRFDTQAQAAKELKVSKDGICDCVNGRLATTGGYTFVWAKYIETIDKNGEPKPDEKILEAFALDLSLINKEVYAFDKDGNHDKYDSPTIAANAKEINYNDVSHCLTGKQKTSKGFTFVLAQDIETLNKDKTISLKQEKIDEILKRFKSKFEIYAVNKKGECLKFDNMRTLSKELDIPRKSAWLCSQGAYATTNGYVILKAEELETTNKKGETVINRTKLKEILKVFQNKAVYAIHRSGKKERYDSQADAAKALDIEPSRVSACIRGARKTSGDYTFISASELEIGFDKNGEPIINIQHLKDAMKRFKNNEVYFIDKYGNCTKYKTQAEAAKATNTDPSDLSRYMNGERELSRGKAFISAERLETYDEDGNLRLNQELIEKMVRRTWKRAIYIIGPNGYYERADGIWEAAMDKKGVYYDSRFNKYMCRDGFNIVTAMKVETLNKHQKDDTCIYDFKANHRKLNWIKEKCQNRSIFLYNIDTQECKKYSSERQAMLKSGGYTFDKLKEEYKLKDNYRIFSANDVEFKAKNGYFETDEEKMSRKLKELAAA